MLEIKILDDHTIYLQGRFDAAQAEHARTVFDKIGQSCHIDCQLLEYISSVGLGILLKTQKRLTMQGHALKLTNLNKHIFDVFRYAGFDTIFEITEA